MEEELLTNDNTTLLPTTSFDGPALSFDFPAFHVGVAEYEEGPTGCTVFYFPQGAAAAVDIRGGECGTIQTQHLAAGDGRIDAICFTGGSEYGFGAVAGVSDELFRMRGYSTAPWDLVQVPGAVIYDFPLRDNAICPDNALGRAALRNARPSMARAIQPFHTIYDGDVFFTATTEEVNDPGLSEIALGVLASELAWDAVLSCLTSSESPDDQNPRRPG